MVVGDKGNQKKDPLGMVMPFRAFAIEHLRHEEEVERRIRMIRQMGGHVVALGPEEDTRFLQLAKMAVAQLTTGTWSIERARKCLVDHLAFTCFDPLVERVNSADGDR
jgi:hypothetical protein